MSEAACSHPMTEPTGVPSGQSDQRYLRQLHRCTTCGQTFRLKVEQIQAQPEEMFTLVLEPAEVLQ